MGIAIPGVGWGEGATPAQKDSGGAFPLPIGKRQPGGASSSKEIFPWKVKLPNDLHGAASRPPAELLFNHRLPGANCEVMAQLSETLRLM